MGDNIYLGDRNGVRTPMQWSADRNAGFSRGQPAAALPAGRSSTPSTTTRRSTSRPSTSNPQLAAVVDAAADRAAQALQGVRPRRRSSSCTPRTARCWPSCAATTDERVLVVANLSRFAQYVELDLSAVPRARCRSSCSARRAFPPIGELPYLLTLGPHAFYWFSLEPQREEAGAIAGRRLGARASRATGAARRRSPPRAAAATSSARSPAFLPTRRWFAGKARASGRCGRATRCRIAGAARPRSPPWCCSCRSSTPRASPRPTSSRWRSSRASGPSGWRPTRRAASWPAWRRRAEPRGAGRRPARPRRLPRAARRGAPPPAPAGHVRRPAARLADRRAGGRIDGDEPPEPLDLRAEQSNTSVVFGQTGSS